MINYANFLSPDYKSYVGYDGKTDDITVDKNGYFYCELICALTNGSQSWLEVNGNKVTGAEWYGNSTGDNYQVAVMIPVVKGDVIHHAWTGNSGFEAQKLYRAKYTVAPL